MEIDLSVRKCQWHEEPLPAEPRDDAPANARNRLHVQIQGTGRRRHYGELCYRLSLETRDECSPEEGLLTMSCCYCAKLVVMTRLGACVREASGRK